MKKSTFQKLNRAKIALQSTLKRILDINKQKKKLSYIKTPSEQYTQIHDELKVLNKVAETQAILVRIYESELSKKTG